MNSPFPSAPLLKQKTQNPILKEKMGPVTEVTVTWGNRILSIFHFSGTGFVNIGSNPSNHIVLPAIGSVCRSAPLLQLKNNDIFIYGLHFPAAYPLLQGEEHVIDMGEGIKIRIAYTSRPPASRTVPLVDLSLQQTAKVLTGFLGTAFFLFYALYPVKEEPKRDEEKDVPHAIFVFSPPIDIQVSPPEEKNTDSKKENRKFVPIPKPSKQSPNMLYVFADKGMQAQVIAAQRSGTAATTLGKNSKEAVAFSPSKSNVFKEISRGDSSTVGLSLPFKKGTIGGKMGRSSVVGLGDKKSAEILVPSAGFSASGNIDKEGIRRTVLENIKQVKFCYERALNQNPGLYGKIVAQWTVGSNGRVIEAGISHSTLNSSPVENCLIGKLKGWQFPLPPAGEVAVVSYPFVFQAQE